jgi:outer membrane lipoprotein-sorting protein
MATDPLDDMPRIRLEKDDLESFHRTRAQSTNKSSKKGNLPDKSTNKSNSPSWFAFLFLLIIIFSATSYWSYEQYKALQQAQNRITDLESRLSATGENMDQSAAALKIKVSELSLKTEDLWGQMDKLWASAWRRNQSEIGVLNKTLMAVKASSEKSTRALSSETTNNNTIIGLVKEQLENQANLLKQINGKLGQSNNVDANFEQQIANLREKLISTALVNNNLTNQIDVLRRRVSVTEKKANEIQILPTPNVTPIQ